MVLGGWRGEENGLYPRLQLNLLGFPTLTAPGLCPGFPASRCTAERWAWFLGDGEVCTTAARSQIKKPICEPPNSTSPYQLGARAATELQAMHIYSSEPRGGFSDCLKEATMKPEQTLSKTNTSRAAVLHVTCTHTSLWDLHGVYIDVGTHSWSHGRSCTLPSKYIDLTLCISSKGRDTQSSWTSEQNILTAYRKFKGSAKHFSEIKYRQCNYIGSVSPGNHLKLCALVCTCRNHPFFIF